MNEEEMSERIFQLEKELRDKNEIINSLEKRLHHLFKSSIISSYDAVKNGVYIKDICEFDKLFINISEEKIIDELCRENIDIMCWYPQPATVISKFSNVSLYKTRKILHNLKKQGYVKFKRGYTPERYSYEGELEEEAFFYCGWELTEIGKSIFKNKIMEFNEILNKNLM